MYVDMRFLPLERTYRVRGFERIAGLDEAGRGPWAGPLVAAAVILPAFLRLPGLKDSKLMTAAKREILADILVTQAAVGVGQASVREIDRWGLTKALEKAYQRAVVNLSVLSGRPPDFLLLDGRDRLNLGYPTQTVIKGDQKIRSIAAASVVAKVMRDRMMQKLGADFTQFGFERHKGYGTRRHRVAIKKWGICKHHRQSYLPIKNYLEANG